ncbi:MAG TPA: oligosaccharide flippase family protein, partial [Blastocatellia bacterium]|nr:oligosaccharide flippase family protein [Blastocatellia bacterium]
MREAQGARKDGEQYRREVDDGFALNLHTMKRFRPIAWLSAGDLLAKTLNFCAFVYLARVLGAESFGVLELAGSLLTYLLLAADGGLEVWATREAAQNKDVRRLVARIVP